MNIISFIVNQGHARPPKLLLRSCPVAVSFPFVRRKNERLI